MRDCKVCGAVAEVAFTDLDDVDHYRCSNPECGAGGFDAGTHRGGEVFQGSGTGRKSRVQRSRAEREGRRA